jgi:hypothetical protein
MRCAGAGEFLVPDDLLQAGQAKPAIVAWPGDAGPAMVEQLALPITIKLRSCCTLCRARVPRNLAGQPFSGAGAKEQVGVGEAQVHSVFQTSVEKTREQTAL